MAVEAWSRPWLQTEPELTLPPLYTAVRLRELGDAFAHAVRVAADSGAGTLVHVGRFDVAEFALVLEPEEPLANARRALYAGMAALSDAVIGAAEPETMVELAWPDALLVFGAMIRLQPQSQREPGDNPNVTNLAEEGFGGALLEESGGGLLSQRLVESFSRHFMVALDAWQEHGFAAVAREYLARLPRAPGQRRDIADNGDLLTRRMASEVDERQSFVAALAAPSWLDPATGAPR
jgi:hypothetical protein